MKVLVIEDEKELHRAIREFLEQEQYVVSSAFSCEEASRCIADYDYDCILLDLMLPDGDGIDLLETIRNSGKKDCVVIISAKNALDDKLRGLELGADDYLTKPFHLAELNARIKTVIRRNYFDRSNTLDIGNLSIDLNERFARVNGTDLQLNRKEFDILLYMAMNKGRLVRKPSLAEHVWGDHYDQADDFDFIYAQIKNLRKKMTALSCEAEIKAVYGVGYKLDLA